LSIGTSPASVVLSVCAAASCVFKCHPSRNPHAEELSNRVRMCDLEEHPPNAAAAGGSRGGLGVPGCHAHIATNGGSATTGSAAECVRVACRFPSARPTLPLTDRRHPSQEVDHERPNLGPERTQSRPPIARAHGRTSEEA
jgi:hypothetical protein